MVDVTDKTEIVPDEEQRLNELAEKPDRTEEETKEFETLRVEKDKRTASKRIEELNRKAKEAERLAEERAIRLEEMEKRLAERKAVPVEPVINKETLEADGKSFYTDNALRSLIDAGKMTETEAYNHQQDRITAQAADRAYNRLQAEQKKFNEENKIADELRSVYSKYPNWQKSHPDFNPNDPVFKTANEYFNDGLSPRRAMETAERLHGIGKAKPDITDDLSLSYPSAPSSTKQVKLPSLTDNEKDNAWRMYRDQVNPATGKSYTVAEAESKYQRSMADRKKYYESRR